MLKTGLSAVLYCTMHRNFLTFASYCQTPGFGLRLGVDFGLPLSQEEQEQEQEEQEEQPLTKIYQQGVY